MNSDHHKIYNRRPTRSHHSTITTSSEYSTTIRTLLNPFRITEEPRQANFTVSLLQEIVQIIQDIANKTSNIQQQLHLNTIFTQLRTISAQIDQANSDSHRLPPFSTLPVLSNEFVGTHISQPPIGTRAPRLDDVPLVIDEHDTRILF